MVTYCYQVYCGDKFEMHRNSKSLCCVTGSNIVLQVNYTAKVNKLIDKEIRIVVTRGGGSGEGELDEGIQKVQTFSYKINKYQGCNLHMINIMNTAVCYIQKLLRE